MSSELTFGQRLKRFLVSLLVLSLLAGVGVLLSQLNVRTFWLEIADGRLVVRKGLLLPFGSEPWRPSDAYQADAYAPLELEGTTPTQVLGVRYTDRDELDRAMFQVIEGLARSRVLSDDPRLLDRGLYFLRRAERLAGLTEEQRLSMNQMRADASFYLARSRIEDAQRTLADGLSQLKLSATSTNRHARTASQMLLVVEPAAKHLDEALRQALAGLSAPPSAGEAPLNPPLGAPSGPLGTAPAAPAVDAGAQGTP